MGIDEVQSLIDALLDKDFLTLEEKEYLNDLGNLVLELEKNINMPDIYGVDMLKALMEMNRVEANELVPVLGSMAYVKSILLGKQDLSQEDIEALSKFFHVSTSVFLPKSS